AEGDLQANRLLGGPGARGLRAVDLLAGRRSLRATASASPRINACRPSPWPRGGACPRARGAAWRPIAAAFHGELDAEVAARVVVTDELGADGIGDELALLDLDHAPSSSVEKVAASAMARRNASRSWPGGATVGNRERVRPSTPPTMDAGGV